MKRHYPDAQERYMRKLYAMDKENKEWEDAAKKARAKKRKPGQPRKAPTQVVAIRIQKAHAKTLLNRVTPKQRRPWLEAMISKHCGDYRAEDFPEDEEAEPINPIS